jgi:small-conductance mechanosensitive channel
MPLVGRMIVSESIGLLIAGGGLLAVALILPPDRESVFASFCLIGLVFSIVLVVSNHTDVVKFFFWLWIRIVAVLSMLGVYFLPAIIAWKRRHRNWRAIMALNLMLGWSLIGWVAALVWSLYTQDRLTRRWSKTSDKQSASRIAVR